MGDGVFSTVLRASPTGAQLAVRQIEADGEARGVVQINHGLAEHGGRYERFARFLATRGYHAVVHDTRGHGLTTAPDALPREFARENGDRKVIGDIDAIHDLVAETHPNLPVICFGHSLGGTLALNYAETRPDRIAGLAVWNANLEAGLMGRLGQAILAAETMLIGSDVPSVMLPKLTFQTWAKSVRNARTEFDWLSRDPAEVDAYIADPECGWDANVSMWKDIFRLLYRGGGSIDRLPKDLPVHLVGGQSDPATENGKAVAALSKRMKAAGMTRVDLLLLPDTRHETLQELNRNEAMTGFADWADKVVAGRTGSG
ncbi:MAG: alpha/beta hydrolase [Rhizobiales bacterium]|nr:alpha/beta hydrolase [Hyphomicrobiales bacterium]MBA69831.1 alpha/beta hydrolase [Hyphomicrobiales bacterium]